MASNGTNFYPYNGTVKVALTDEQGNADLVRCTVANIPASVAGYAIGCLLKATDTGGIYTNTGTASSCTFTLLEDAGGSFTLPVTATDASTTTGTSVAFTQNAVTTGAGFTQSLNGLTTGFGHSITHTTAVIANGGSLLNLSSTSVDTSTTTGILQNLSSSASTAGTQSLLTASALTTGIASSIVVAALTSGVGHKVTATAATLTTGRYYSANDGALEVFGVGANGHLHTTQTTAPTIAVTQQNGITAAAITAGASDVNGIITTTGTNNNGGATILQVTFHKTYTAAPKSIVLTARNASGAGPNPPFVSAITATTFDITVPASASAGATPSWNYFVIA